MATPPQRFHELTPIDTGPNGSNPDPILPLRNPLPPPDNCVICLDQISDKAVALPCRHDQFNFSCLGTWLQRQQVCPLCKAEVTAVRFKVESDGNRRTQVFYLPPPEQPPPSRGATSVAGNAARQQRLRQHRPYSRGGRGRYQGHVSIEASKDNALDVRRQVYRQKMFSLHVGSNRISRYRNLTPASFVTDERLATRARMFIRRELQVFDFLNPNSSGSPSGQRSSDRRASNADFLLEYIIGILKSIDLKGSTGQAEELLKDFLGRENARLFLHELEAWLRSPYENLKDWDRAVQYAVPVDSEDDASGSRSTLRPFSACDRANSLQSSTPAPTVPRWFSDGFVLRDLLDQRHPR